MQVYLITHKESGKTYVGKTVMKNLHWYLSVKRWQVKNEKVCGMPIISAILKYGWSAFDVQSVTTCETEEELNGLERLWIAVLDSTHVGYNVCHGGEGPTLGRKLSQETKDKIGAASKGRKPKVYIRTEEHRQQLRDRMRAGGGAKAGRLGGKRAAETLKDRLSLEKRQAWSKKGHEARWGAVTC